MANQTRKPSDFPVPRMMRCKAQLNIRVPGAPEEYLWPGLVVNFDRVVIPATESKPAVLLADVVVGRESCFEPAPDEPGPDAADAAARG